MSESFQVISRNIRTGEIKVAIDKLNGKPLSLEQAERFKDRACAACDCADTTYEIKKT